MLLTVASLPNLVQASELPWHPTSPTSQKYCSLILVSKIVVYARVTECKQYDVCLFLSSWECSVYCLLIMFFSNLSYVLIWPNLNLHVAVQFKQRCCWSCALHFPVMYILDGLKCYLGNFNCSANFFFLENLVCCICGIFAGQFRVASFLRRIIFRISHWSTCTLQ
jgi:hypothetical protein